MVVPGCAQGRRYRVSHLLVELGRDDFDLGVPPSCPAVQPLLPNFHQSRQNQAHPVVPMDELGGTVGGVEEWILSRRSRCMTTKAPFFPPSSAESSLAVYAIHADWLRRAARVTISCAAAAAAAAHFAFRGNGPTDRPRAAAE